MEFIIVDDGSTDSTSDILGDYISKDKRIKILTQKNQGPAIARNNGVAEASGKYIAFMDSDDACAVNRLELQLNFLENNTQYSACCLNNLGNMRDYFPGIRGIQSQNHIGHTGSIFQQPKWKRFRPP